MIGSIRTEFGFYMNTLQRFDQNGVEIIIDTTTGESFATISGYARMAGKHKTTVTRRLKGVASEKQKTAEIKTQGGLQGVTLLHEEFIAEWMPKDNPPMASKLMLLGVRLFLHKMAGYEVTTTAVPNTLEDKGATTTKEPKTLEPKYTKEDYKKRLEQCTNEELLTIRNNFNKKNSAFIYLYEAIRTEIEERKNELKNILKAFE